MNVFIGTFIFLVEEVYLSISVEQAFYSGAEQGHVLLQHLSALLYKTEARHHLLQHETDSIWNRQLTVSHLISFTYE